MATLSTNTAPYERPFLMLRRTWPTGAQVDLAELQREGMRWPKGKKRVRSEEGPQTFALPFPRAERSRPVAESTRKVAALLALASRSAEGAQGRKKARKALRTIKGAGNPEEVV